MRKENNTLMPSFMKDKNTINEFEYKRLFVDIEKSSTTEKLNQIARDFRLEIVENKKYPKLQFQLNNKDVDGLLDGNGEVSINQKDLDPIAKLLYAMIWKQGDLQKLKHIIRGIRDSEKESTEFDSDAIVFHSFGNHLANHLENPSKSPIIVQHVIRAYNVFDNFPQEERFRKIDKVKKED